MKHYSRIASHFVSNRESHLASCKYSYEYCIVKIYGNLEVNNFENQLTLLFNYIFKTIDNFNFK